MIPKLTGNDKGIIAIILVVLALFMFFISRESDAAEVAIGQAVIGSTACEFQSLTVGLDLGEHWNAFLATHGNDTCGKRGDIEANLGIGAMRYARLNKWQLGFGGSIWQHSDPAVGDKRQELHLRAAIQVRYWFLPLTYGEILHFSSAGSMARNPGMNFLNIGRAIKE